MPARIGSDASSIQSPRPALFTVQENHRPSRDNSHASLPARSGSIFTDQQGHRACRPRARTCWRRSIFCVPYLVDQRRLGIMGWSFGGIVTIFAASRSDAFRAVVDQAGGALTWAARKSRLPAANRETANEAIC